MDSRVYLLIPLLLIGFIPGVYADIEHGLNYDKETLQIKSDGTKIIKWSSHSERIKDTFNIYQDFIFTDSINDLTVETRHGSVQLNKNTCGFNYYPSGFITDNNKLFSDSILPVIAINGTDIFNEVSQITASACETYWTGSELVAKKYASGIGFMEYKYVNSNSEWKTQLEATNLTSLTDRKFGFIQSIDLQTDSIKFGNSTKNLDNFNGVKFERSWVENNESKILDLLNGVTFDFDLAHDNLNTITIYDTGLNKSKLVFHFTYNNSIVLPNETLILDPTYTSNNPTNDGYVSDTSNNNICDTGSTKNSVTNNGYISTYPTASSPTDCIMSYSEFPLSGIPSSATVDDVTFDFELWNVYSAENCDYVSLGTTRESDSASSIMTAILTGTVMLSNDSTCSATGTNLSVDLGTVGNSEVQTRVSAGDSYFSMGFRLTDLTLTATQRGSIYGAEERANTPDPTLTIVYHTTLPPDSITDLSLDSVTQTTATVSFTAPNLNTGNLTTYTINLDTPQTNNVITFNQNFTSNPLTLTGLVLGTPYSANATAITEGGANYTLANILNFTTSSFNSPGAPTLSALALGDTSLRFTSVAGISGDNATKDYGLRCELNSVGGWLDTVSNSTIPSNRIYEYTGLTLGDNLICQWRDGSADGFSGWSNNATDNLVLSVLTGQRTDDTDDKLLAFINFIAGQGGVYFGLGVIPFAIMLVGFMAGKKTVRIFTLATLFLMGIVHASGYYVYPSWYWSLTLLFGIGLVMGRMKSD